MDERHMLALAVSSAVFQSLRNAAENPIREEYWRKHADMLEHKFTTDYGRHYSYFLTKEAQR